jgi:hypothetical protein
MSESPEFINITDDAVLDFDGYLVYAHQFDSFFRKCLRDYQDSDNCRNSLRVLHEKLYELYNKEDVYIVHSQPQDKPLPCQLLRSGQAWIQGEVYFELSLKFRPTVTDSPEPSPDDIQSPLDDIRQSMQDAD